jgi:hypothetical protein
MSEALKDVNELTIIMAPIGCGGATRLLNDIVKEMVKSYRKEMPEKEAVQGPSRKHGYAKPTPWPSK